MRENLLLELVAPYPALMVVFRRLQEQEVAEDQHLPTREAVSSASKDLAMAIAKPIAARGPSKAVELFTREHPEEGPSASEAVDKIADTAAGSSLLADVKPELTQDFPRDCVPAPATSSSWTGDESIERSRVLEECSLLWDTAKLRQRSPSIRAAEPYVDRHAETWFVQSLRCHTEEAPYGWEAFREDLHASSSSSSTRSQSGLDGIAPGGDGHVPRGRLAWARDGASHRSSDQAAEAVPATGCLTSSNSSSCTGFRLNWIATEAVRRNIQGDANAKEIFNQGPSQALRASSRDGRLRSERRSPGRHEAQRPPSLPPQRIHLDHLLLQAQTVPDALPCDKEANPKNADRACVGSVIES
mmetsp:Transcript_73579/g.137500  ORF Transcript_73579/g.137500 Transcript_73579/m.137500 type:complete len:358 (+) Transcript_73579:104-1177(+)